MLLPQPCTPRMITPRVVPGRMLAPALPMFRAAVPANASDFRGLRRWPACRRHRRNPASPNAVASLSWLAEHRSQSRAVNPYLRHNRLRDCPLGLFFGQTAQIVRHRHRVRPRPTMRRKVRVFPTRTIISSMICRRRCLSGRGNSRYSTRLANSGGILIDGAVMIDRAAILAKISVRHRGVAAPPPGLPCDDESP